MVDITWSLSGVDMTRWRLQAVSMWRPPVSVRRTVIEAPGRHGTRPTGRPPRFEEPAVSLEVAIQVGTQVDLEAAASELGALLSAPGLVLGRESGGIVTEAPAELVSISPGDFITAREAVIETVLAIPGVFLRGTQTDHELAPIVSPAVVTVPPAAAGTGPVTDAIIRMTGPLSSVQLVDDVTGTGISWTGGPITATDYLFLDPATLTARISTTATDWTAGGSDASPGLDYPPAGPLQIWPRMAGLDPADRAATVTITGTDFDVTTAPAFRIRPAYL